MKHISETGAFELTKNDIKALLAFAGADTFRAHLCGVHFRPREGDAIATDGISLVRAKNCGQSDGEPYTVSREALSNAARMLRRKTDVLHVSRSDEALTMGARSHNGDGPIIGSMGGPDALIDANFPPIDKVIPPYEATLATSETDTVAKFDAALLARLQLVQKAADCSGLRVRYGDDALCPVRYDAEANPTAWTAVVMPLQLKP